MLRGLSRVPVWALAAIFSLPLLVALISRLFNGYWWWNDFDAMACAGIQASHGLQIYAAHPLCPGLRPAAFVYPPQIAWALQALIGVFGVTTAKIGYVIVYSAASLWLGWLLFFKRLTNAPARQRLIALGLVTGGVIACGNVALLCHALIAASLFGFRRTRLPFILAVALATVIKPVFVVALVVLLVERADLRVRIARLGVAAAVVGAAFALVLVTGWSQLPAWMAAIERTVLTARPGSGFLGWASSLGLEGHGVFAISGWLVFAATMTLAGARIVRARAFSEDEVWLFGLGLAQLINPRLMGYDLQMLAPTIAVAMAAAGGLRRTPSMLVGRGLQLVCGGGLVLACCWQVSLAAELAPLVVCVILLYEAMAMRAPARARAAALHPADLQGPAPMMSVVICTLDEHESIGRVIRELSHLLADVPHEIIVVDDSRDERTAEAVTACMAAFPGVRLIRRKESWGLASAAIKGWSSAEGELLAIMDGDGQHEPAHLRALYDLMRRGDADIAVGSRYLEPGGTGLKGGRNAISRAGTALAHLLLGADTTDPMSGLFVMRRPWFEAARPKLSSAGFKILIDVMVSGPGRPRVVETKTALRPRLGGASKLDLRVIADLAALLIEKRTNGLVSVRFALFLAVGVTGIAVHLAALQALRSAGAAFYGAQAGAILAAMTSNFFINNALTFRDQRLRGEALIGGLGAFYLSCLGGAVINEALAAGAKELGAPWLLAALLGIIAGALINFALVRRLTWRGEQAKGGAASAPMSPLSLSPARATSASEDFAGPGASGAGTDAGGAGQDQERRRSTTLA